jgi:protein-disulfide isomerase
LTETELSAMSKPWKIAALGGGIGALAAILVVFGVAALGFFPPPSDRQFEAYLMDHPAIIFSMQAKVQSQQADLEQRQLQAAVDKIGLKTFLDPRIAFVTGPANSKRTLVEFFDYNCGHCRNSFPIIRQFYNAHKADTRFAFIEFPIFGVKSNDAARAALAARQQPDKYVAFHFALMGEDGEIGPDQIVDAAHKAGLDVNKLMTNLSEPTIDKELAAAHTLAARAGIAGTPFFIINGKAHSGEVDETVLKDMSKV